jgi:hypothetical protein
LAEETTDRHTANLPCKILQGFLDDPGHGDHGERLGNLRAWARGETAVIEIGTFESNDS